MAGEAPFSNRSRIAALESMQAQPVDLLVVGGGITGAGIARDAALRGLRTAVVDGHDFGSGTSSRSSRLIHGGLRYLEHLELGLVLEASRERRVLLQTAPHLVRPTRFLFPVYRGGRVSPMKLRAGMWLYDVLAGFRNTHMHRWLSPKRSLDAEPGLRDRDLRGAAVYWDAQADDVRLVLATLRGAGMAGALVANYAAVTSFVRAEGRIVGAVIRDALSGEERLVRALTVVNATGPWVDRIRHLDAPNAAPLIRASKGAHAIVRRDRLGLHDAVTIASPIDGRVMFLLPWNDLAYIGTTETEDNVEPDAVRATGEDVIYLLRSANAVFPRARLSPNDVIATWAGLRPLLAADPDVPAGRVSREHRIEESPSGLITIAGGKLTTYRVMGRDVVDLVVQRLRQIDGRQPPPRATTEVQPLPGGEIAALDVMMQSVRMKELSPVTARHLVDSYGTESAAILNLVTRNKVLGGPLVAGRAEIRAEVVYAVEREMAMRLTDVLIRRLHLFYEDPQHGTGVAANVARKMAELLGWDSNREDDEIGEYLEEVRKSREFLREVGRASQAVG
ncbi:MAG TPA: glycerol-3-phosphate dehydrogenase/oxidase [Gemmatimonadales bacterium]|nr:glycerol-3-phosphate dehydrogenase/oxidase [Gemmatimonadales bacterium]